jgi:quinol monooxygenase YgiN
MSGRKTPKVWSPPAAEPPSQSAKFVIHLNVRVADSNLQAFLDFLREAVPFYEEPGGIKIRLLQNTDDPNSFIEVVEYVDHEIYRRDQERVNSDPRMQGYLARWREFLSGPPQVTIYRDISDEIPKGG